MDNNLEYVLPIERDDVEHVNKKKRKKKRIVISVVTVFVVLLLCVILSFIFPKSIKGEWELVVNPEITQATPDEVNDSDRVYYSFSKPNKYGEGSYTTYYDGGVEEGTYKLSEQDGKSLINLGTQDLEFKITGSKILRIAKLTITFPETTDEMTGESHPSEDYIFVLANAPNYEKESYDSFDKDNALIGEWATNERTLSYYMYELSYTQTVEFFDNGIMTIHYESADLALDRYMYYAYSASDGELKFSPVTDKETEFSVSYEFDENGNLVFVEDNTNGSIFADEFFSTVTYYTPENLPQDATEIVSETE